MMPPGKYYIGDLCYVMHPEWDEFCNLTISGNSVLNGEFALKDGRRFATYNTKYGDGLYRDQYGNKYSVDAGLIGCILFDDIRDETLIDVSKLGSVVIFDRPFDVYSRDGVLHFGHVVIDTTGEEEWEEDEEHEYDCE